MKNIKRYKLFIFILLLIIIVSIVLTFYFSSSFFQKKAIINYLNSKYGNNEYTITEIKKKTNFSEKTGKEYYTYIASFSTQEVEDAFVELYINNLVNVKCIYDNFIEKYYNSYVNNNLFKDDPVVSFYFKTNLNNTSEKYGTIPSIDKIMELDHHCELGLIVNPDNSIDLSNEDNRCAYLKQLSEKLVKFLNSSQNINFSAGILEEDESYFYKISVSSNTITIHNKFEYTAIEYPRTN